MMPKTRRTVGDRERYRDRWREIERERYRKRVKRVEEYGEPSRRGSGAVEET